MDGGSANIVRSDNHRELLRQAAEEASGECLTEEALDRTVQDIMRTPHVTDHFVAIHGYETDASGRITALLARDNAVAGTAEARFEVLPDGSITKPAEPSRPEKYLRQEHQLSEVRFHTSLPHTGASTPTNDTGQRMVW